jgi:predicted  nucleic acid-binding Zn-ribbon protein
MKLLSEISRLEAIKEAYKQSYISNFEFLEEKLSRINVQIDNTNSGLKREILTKQREHYQIEIDNLDQTMEKSIDALNVKIDQLEKKHKELEIQAKKEVESFDFNIEQIRGALERRNVGEVFNVLENMTNALVILKKEQTTDFS